MDFLLIVPVRFPPPSYSLKCQASVRNVGLDELFDDDSMGVVGVSQPTSEKPQAEAFQPILISGPVAAIDCGIVRLGETESGLIIALRASIVIGDDKQPKILMYRTGPIYLHSAYRVQALHQMGKHLQQNSER